MTDLATLGMVIDSSQVPKGVSELDKLTAAGTKAEGSIKRVGAASVSAGAAAAAMAAQAQVGARAAMGLAGSGVSLRGSMQNARIAMLDMTHVGINMTQMLASGVNPMRALVMESGRIATAIQYSSGGISGLVKRFAEMIGIIKVTRDAELAEEAANATAAATAVKSAAQRAAASVAAADTEIALATAAVRTAATSEELTLAQARLTKAHQAVASAAAEATIAETALAEAEGRAAEAGKASAAATRIGIGGAGIALAGLAVVAGVAYGAIKQFQDQVKDSGELDKFAEGLRLTDSQIEKAGGSVKYLSDRTREITGLTVTFGDVMYGVWHEVAREISDPGPWNTLAKNAATVFDWMLGAWSKVSAGISAGLMSMTHFIVEMAKGGMHGADLSKMDMLGDVQRRYADELKRNQEAFAGIEKAALDHKKKMLQIESDSNKPPKPPKPKKVSDHGLADALAQLDAQIKGQNALAAAYQVSDAAAIKAEALQKAEEQAIRHKGEVGVFYEKELALAVAQRAAEGGKMIADIHSEAAARSVVNDLVEQGIIPVQRMGQALEEQQKKRQLMAALAVAEDKKWLQQAADLRDEIANLSFSQGVLNDELAKEAALRQIASNKDQLDELQLETKLVGASNRVRAERLAILQAEQYIRDNGITDPKDKGDVTSSYTAAADAATDLAEAQNNYNAALTATLDHLKLIEEQAQSVGQILSDAFGGLGDSIGNALTALASYQSKQQEIADWAREEKKKAGTDAVQLANIEAQAQQKSATAQVQAVGSLLSATKGLFKEHSTGYKVMQAAEAAYAAFQAATTIAAMVRDATHTASSVANSATRAAADEAAGASKIFSQLGVYAFPVVAAMVALLATFALGGKGGGGSSPSIPTAEDVQAQQGAGTVLGDAKAKSASIADALELMAKNSTKGLDYSSDMVSTLRSISSGIGNLAASIARSLDLKGGFFDTTGKTGTNSSGGFLGLFATTKTTSLFDQGVQFNPSTVQQIIANGISGATYQVLETVKHNSGFLGIGGSTKTSYNTTTGALDGDISKQIQLIIGQLYTSVVQAAKVLGLDVAAALQTFQVEIGKISFKDLTGDQITDALNSVFSKVGDQMAGFAVEGLAGFQKAGEGLFETLMRLAKDYLTIDAALKSIGMTFGSVGSASVAAREHLIELAGGLDAFTDQVNFFYDHFLSDTDKLAFAQQQVDAAFQALGISQPPTIEAFKSLIQGLNLSTDAGQALFEKLMEIAPAFYDAATAADQLLAKKQGLQVQLLQAQGDTAGATDLQRQIDLAKLDPALQDLQKQVYAAQDAASAAAAAQKLKNEQDQLQIQLLEAQGKASEALALKRQMELASMDESLRGLQEQIYHEQDIAAAKANLVAAYQRESAALKDTADKFHKFADDLKAFRDSLFTSNDSTTSYNQALTKLMQQAGAAAAGDETALGGGLQDSAQKFLDIAQQNAGSLQDVERARALVARYLDQAIGSAEKKASVAEQQLAAMERQVGKLVDLDDHVLTVSEAIKALNKVLHDTPKAQKDTETHQRKMEASMDEVVAATREHAINSGKINKRFATWDRGAGMAVVTDDDAPLDVSVGGQVSVTATTTAPLPVQTVTPA